MQKNKYLIRLVTALLSLALLFSLPLSVPPRQAHAEGARVQQEDSLEADTIELSIRASSESSFRSVIRIRSKKWAARLRAMKPIETKSIPVRYLTIELALPGSGNAGVYEWNGDGTVSSSGPSGALTYEIPDSMKEPLTAAIETLKKNHFGKPADWPAATRLLPKGAIFTITDLETGLSFRGQRRAGSSHADVQPITRQDSAIMKQIYGGKWSWNRRAVLVDSPEGKVAGSMHGMPHGGDGIPDNGFNGHFCIHYKGSVTHGSGNSDPAHQVMVHKAAGTLDSYHRSLSPSDLVQLFLLAANQKDRHLVTLLLNPASSHKAALTGEWLDESFLSARRVDMESESPPPTSDQLSVQLRTRINISRQGSRPHALWLRWSLIRPEPGQAWLIDDLYPEGAVK